MTDYGYAPAWASRQLRIHLKPRYPQKVCNHLADILEKHQTNCVSALWAEGAPTVGLAFPAGYRYCSGCSYDLIKVVLPRYLKRKYKKEWCCPRCGADFPEEGGNGSFIKDDNAWLFVLACDSCWSEE